MAELRTAEPLPRTLLIQSIAARLHHVVPGFRPIAQDLLADASRIDVFGAADDGAAVLALLGEREADALALLARAVAQREWLVAHLPDWLKLAPDLGVRSGAPVQAVVLCPHFGTEAVAAARAVDRGPLQLVTWRCVRNGSEADVLLERLFPAGPAGAAAPASGTRAASGFRTGLSDADLGLSPEERAEFE